MALGFSCYSKTLLTNALDPALSSIPKTRPHPVSAGVGHGTIPAREARDLEALGKLTFDRYDL
jgi:hypothetical protein